MIPRAQYKDLKDKIANNKLLLVTGPRAVGKQTIIQEILTATGLPFLELSGKNKTTKKEFETVDSNSLNTIFGQHRFVVIHEAQYLEKLQTIIEEVLSSERNVTLILACSYEPVMDEVLREVLQLQGLELQLLPPTFYELAQYNGLTVEEKLLDQRLIYGNYPAVVANLDDADLTGADLTGVIGYGPG